MNPWQWRLVCPIVCAQIIFISHFSFTASSRFLGGLNLDIYIVLCVFLFSFRADNIGKRPHEEDEEDAQAKRAKADEAPSTETTAPATEAEQGEVAGKS